jgi:hypothetical protein
MTEYEETRFKLYKKPAFFMALTAWLKPCPTQTRSG